MYLKTALIYCSDHGTTEKVAGMIANELTDQNVEIINVKRKKKIDLSEFDLIIIGSSVHSGKNQAGIRTFIRENLLVLLQKRIALYLCCMNESVEKDEFNKAYPQLLRQHSEYNAIAGGEYLIDKMNFLERFIIRRISGLTGTVSNLKTDEIIKLTNQIKANSIDKI